VSADDSFRQTYGPCALVAGAAVGLGAEYARQLAARGLDLVLLDRDRAPLEATVAALRAAHPVAVMPVVLDLARPDLLDALVVATRSCEIGLVVYNAAIGTVAPFLEMTPEHASTMIDVNCRGPMLFVHALAPAMVARGRGGIILMSSMSGSFGSEQLALYAATKAFDLILAESLWAELRHHGVDVLAVQPGSTRTPGWESSQPANRPDPGGHVPGVHVMEVEPVVQEALAALGREPSIVPGEANREGASALRGLPRRQAIEIMSQITSALLRNDR
jgi:short-subunit dehydrogenase